MAKYKCSECGFLSRRNYYTQTLDESSLLFRTSLKDDMGDNSHKSNPVCFRLEYNLWDEAKTQNVLDVINRERPCKSYVEWQQGYSPKEHGEMIDRKWEKKWHWIELIAIIILTGLFSWFIDWISRSPIPPIP